MPDSADAPGAGAAPVADYLTHLRQLGFGVGRHQEHGGHSDRTAGYGPAGKRRLKVWTDGKILGVNEPAALPHPPAVVEHRVANALAHGEAAEDRGLHDQRLRAVA